MKVLLTGATGFIGSQILLALIEKYGAGVSIPPESGPALASEILRLYKDGKEREALGVNARLASGHFQRNVQAKKMIDFITKFY